jgi:hypothetical protein
MRSHEAATLTGVVRTLFCALGAADTLLSDRVLFLLRTGGWATAG